MLILEDTKHNKIAPLPNAKDVKIERDLQGNDTLSFSYAMGIDDFYSSILPQCFIVTPDQEYVIKEVNPGEENYADVVAVVNTEDLKSLYNNAFIRTNVQLDEIAHNALVGSAWTFDSDVTKLRSLTMTNSTALDILKKIAETYMCDIKFDAKNKIVIFRDILGSETEGQGVYFIDKLNLVGLEVQSNTYDFCTRLIPVGQDNLYITDVNAGLPYVENYQYCNQIVVAYWDASQYTDKNALKADAIEKLKVLSTPTVAYKANVRDLANLMPNQYKFLNYKLGDFVRIRDNQKQIEENVRIVKTADYPFEPENNQIELNSRYEQLEDIELKHEQTDNTVSSITTPDGGGINGDTVDKIDWTKVQNVQVVNAQIGDAEITTAKISQAQITTALIQDATITTAKIGDLQVTNEKVVSLSANKINTGTLDASKITVIHMDAGSIDVGTLSGSLVNITNLNADNIVAGTLDGRKARISHIDADEIVSGTIDANLISVINLSASNINTGYLNADRIYTGTLTGDKLVAGTITATQIAANTITAKEIDSHTITANEIATDTITAESGIISAAAIGTAQIQDAAITGAKIDVATIDTANIKNAAITTALIDVGAVNTQQVADGSITDAKIVSLTANKITAGTIDAGVINVVNLNADNITVGTINGQYIANGAITNDKIANDTITKAKISQAFVDDLDATYATIINLNVAVGRINTLETNSATITDLQTTNGNITNLTSDVATIRTLVNGNITSTNMAAGAIQAGDATIANGAISSAQIISLDVAKLNAGNISTNKFVVTSDSGNLKIQGNTLHVWDNDGKERISLGLNGTDYNLLVRGADGTTVLFGTDGVTHAGITDGAVDNSKVAENANISGGKIEKESLVTQINGATTTLKSSKIKFDDTGQTLDVAFTSLKNTVTDTANTVSSQGTTISAVQGDISSKIWQTDITGAIDGINIGGTNRARNTSTPVTLTGFTGAKNYCPFLYNMLTSGLKAQTTIVISFTLTYSNATNSGNPLVYVQSQGNITGWGPGLFIKDITNLIDWSTGSGNIKIVSYNTLNAEQMTNDYFSINVRFDNITGGSFVVSNFQAEEGNKATAWSPAPEDVQGQITTINQNYSTLSQTVGGITSTVGSLQTSLDSTNSNVTSVTDRVSTVEQSVNGLTSTITSVQQNYLKSSDALSTYATQSTVSTLQQDLNGFSSTLSSVQTDVNKKAYSTDVTNSINTAIDDVQIGGTNLFKNSNFYKDIDNNVQNGWYDFNSSVVSYGTGYNGINRSIIISVSSNYYRIQQDALIKPNSTYTISFMAKGTFNIFAVGMIDINMGSWNPCRDPYWDFNTSGNYSSWQKFSKTINTQSNAVRVVFIIEVNAQKSAELTEFKLEEGNKATAWSPAPEDVQGQIDTVNGTISSIQSTISTQSSSITQLQNSISSKVESSTFTSYKNSNDSNISSLQSRMSSAEQKITSDAIVSTVRSSTSYTNDLTGKVSTNEIISTINQSAETVAIDASKINLNGYVTVSSLQASGSTVIDGSRIATGYISADRIQANSIDASKIYIGSLINYAEWSNKNIAGTSPWDSSAIVDTSVVYISSASLKLQPNTIGCQLKTHIPVSKNNVLYFKLYLKKDSNWDGLNNNSKFRIANQNNSLLANWGFSAATTDWTSIEGYYTVPDDSITSLLISIGNDATIGNIWVADIIITKSSGGTLLANGTITTDKIVSDAITADKIASHTITANEIASNTITSAEIKTGSIVADDLQAGTITSGSACIASLNASKITTGTLDANLVNVIHLNASNITAGTISGDRISGGTITGITLEGATVKTTDTSDWVELSDQNLLFYQNGQVLMELSHSSAFGTPYIQMGTGGARKTMAEMRTDANALVLHADLITPPTDTNGNTGNSVSIGGLEAMGILNVVSNYSGTSTGNGDIFAEGVIRADGTISSYTGFSGLGQKPAYSDSIYISNNSSITIYHGLGYHPFIRLSGTLGNLILTTQDTSLYQTTIYCYSGGGGSFSGYVYMW
ncbi:phage tail spike protein [Clostridium tyrobutyricum]|uniref:phage tail spike protein n=1 Tax=Clostridium tyrobutyricum TaxID=1519 RepID=UPI001C3CE52F|nr:phage tail spike protein [Clostridium tyrobutyricum]MBV4438577.1 phage tail protein [Clostridium tyrobutyricum]